MNKNNRIVANVLIIAGLLVVFSLLLGPARPHLYPRLVDSFPTTNKQNSQLDSSLTDDKGQPIPESLYSQLISIGQEQGGNEYLIQPGLTGFNLAHDLKTEFGSDGVTISAGQENSAPKLRLKLNKVSFETNTSLSLVGLAPTTQKNRVEYKYNNGLTEWYVNGPMGLEQGFTFENPLSKTGSRLEIQLELEGSQNIQQSDKGIEIKLKDNQLLNYGQLYAYDAKGIRLESSLKMSGTTISLLVNTQNAVYPVTVDPLFTKVQKIIDPVVGQPGDNYGYSTVFSKDGNTAIVGVPGKYSQTGAVYIFTRTANSLFSQAQVVTASDGLSGDRFGNSLSLTPDNNNLLVGAYRRGNVKGGAYLFTRSGNAPFTQAQALTALDGVTDDLFGTALALSSDGNTAIIGAPQKTVNNQQAQGALYIFTRTVGAAFSQSQLVTDASGTAFDELGGAIAISGDGNTILAGASGKTFNGNYKQGAAFAYTRIAGSPFSQIQGFSAANNELGIYFGTSVALNNDGTAAIIGAPISNFGQGAAYVFTRTLGSTFSQIQEINPNDFSQGDRFGWSVALSDDTNTAIIGAYLQQVSGANYQGAAYIFTRTAATAFTQSQKLTTVAGNNGSYFGFAVALSGNGNNALVGAWAETIDGTSQQGAAHIFTRTVGNSFSQSQTLAEQVGGQAYDRLGWSVALSGDGNTALVGLIGKNNYQGAAYVFTRTAGLPFTRVQKFSDPAGAANDQFGKVVALSSAGDIALVSSWSKAINGNIGQGAVFIYTRTPNSLFTQSQVITALNGTTYDDFGNNLAISQDGSTILVAAFNKTINGNQAQGAVYVFTHTVGAPYTQAQQLIASDGIAHDLFGNSVALNQNGNIALVGTYTKANYKGAVYLFTRTVGSNFSQAQIISATDGNPGDSFGISVALDSEGDTALIGASAKNSSGQAYIFTHNLDSTYSQSQILTNSMYAGVNFGFAVALKNDGSTALISAPNQDTGLDGGAIAFTRSANSTYKQSQIITITDSSSDDKFGFAIALSADASTAFVSAPDQFINGNNAQGAVYVYQLPPSSVVITASPLSSVYGQPITLTGTVSGIPLDQNTPTGSVTFFIDNLPVGTASIIPTTNYATYLYTSTLPVGIHSMSARYNSGNLFPSLSASTNLQIIKAQTSTTLDSLQNPTISGQIISFTSSVRAVSPGSGLPTGSVSLKEGATVLATVVLDNHGQAVLTVPSLSLGNHLLTVNYSGDNNFVSSDSPGFTQQVVDICSGQVVSKGIDDGSCGTFSYAAAKANQQNNPNQPFSIGFITPVVTVTTNITITNPNGVPVTLNGGCISRSNGGLPGVQFIGAVNGSNVLPDGIRLGSNVTFAGFSVTGFNNFGLEVQGNNSLIKCTYIGVGKNGTTISSNGGIGVHLVGSNTQLGLAGLPGSGNVIAGSLNAAIKVENGSKNNQAYNNLLGYLPDGTPAYGGRVIVVSGGQLKFGANNRIKV